MRASGMRRVRYPVRWHRIEAQPGFYDWSTSDAALDALRDAGLAPIVDLVHHTSYPRWLSGGFADPRFGDAYLRFCHAFADRYPWVGEYTLFNEPFATLFLAGHEAIWPPYGRGVENFVALVRNVVPAVLEASRRLRERLPDARHVYVDTCEGHAASDPSGAAYARMANDRRFFVLDLLLGRAGDRERPFLADVVAAGGEDLLELEPGHLDVLGLDYYAHSEWSFRCREGEVEGRTPSECPVGLAALVGEYAERYPELPLILSETNIRGTPSDRATWLKHTLEQCERARAAGARLEAYCWFPFIDSLDWNSLLARADGCIDPVGVFWLDAELERRPSSMSRAFTRAAHGASSADLPAYRFSPPVARWVSGLLPFMSRYDWGASPAEEADMDAERIVRATNRVERAA
jgi:beta-glucosidase/6-phospho-beta-glucosidase/beta-galactosidase